MARPADLPRDLYWSWDNPHRHRAAVNPRFRLYLDHRGYLTPNFRVAEFNCKCPRHSRRGSLRDGSGSLRRRFRDLAFKLERVRHDTGVPLPVLSGHRCYLHNREVHGAKQSQHLRGAGDVSNAWVQRVGHANVLKLADKYFGKDGFGDYPSGSVHFDIRGWRARWSTYVGW